MCVGSRTPVVCIIMGATTHLIQRMQCLISRASRAAGEDPGACHCLTLINWPSSGPAKYVRSVCPRRTLSFILVIKDNTRELDKAK